MNASSESRGAAIARVLEAYRTRQLSEHEADAYLRATHGITLEKARHLADPRLDAYDRRNRLLAVTSGLLLLFLVVGVFTSIGNNPTGFAITTFSEETATNASYPITDTVTQLRASGTLTGEGTATLWFEHDGTRSLVGTVTSDPGTPRTAQASYAAGDTVEIDHLPQDATVYLDDGVTTVVTSVPFAAPAASAEVLIVANESGELTTYRIPLTIGDAPRVTAFDNLCVETCTIGATNGTLIVEIDGDASVQITATGETPEANRAPIVAIPFAPVTVNETITIDLGTHIVDPDGDVLLYSAGLSGLVDAQVTGDILTLTPAADGVADLAIYASDLEALIETSIPITVIVGSEPTVNATNDTNVTVEPPIVVNQTIETNVTATPTNVTTPLDCSAANPNERPVECLLADSTEYFPDEDIFLENLDRVRVAKLNMVGNLLLTGDVYQYSAGAPGARDFVIGQPDRDGNVIVSAWVDTATGDLHLRGQLIEEELNVNPPSGSYSILTKRSIYLAYVDLSTGDMHLRGNLIPYRRSLE